MAGARPRGEPLALPSLRSPAAEAPGRCGGRGQTRWGAELHLCCQEACPAGRGEGIYLFFLSDTRSGLLKQTCFLLSHGICFRVLFLVEIVRNVFLAFRSSGSHNKRKPRAG